MSQTVMILFGSTDFTGSVRMGYYFARSYRNNNYRVVAICGLEPPSNISSVVPALHDIGCMVKNEEGFERFLSLSLLKKTRKHIIHYQPLVVISMVQLDAKIGSIAACLSNVPFVLSAQNITKFYGNLTERIFKTWAYGFLMRRCCCLAIATSEPVYMELTCKYKIRKNNCDIVPNGIDTSQFSRLKDDSRKKLRKSLNVDDSQLMFTSVGRLDSQKGFHHLIDAIVNISEKDRSKLKIFLVGDITPNSESSIIYSRDLKTAVAKHCLQDQIVFLGWRDNVKEILGATDVYVHPASWEGWSLAIVEAMASELPFIITDCSGTPTGYVEGEQGFVIEKDSPTALKETIQKILTVPRIKLLKMGIAARKIAEDHYDINLIGQRFINTIENHTRTD